MRVIAIDVGIKICGYVICDINNIDVSLIKEDEIKPPAQYSLPHKLYYIFEELSNQIEKFLPQAVIVEKLYSHYRYPVTLGVLAQIKGVVSFLSYKFRVDFSEFASTRARKSFLGKGSANSLQVKKMAENITGRRFKSIHTADAFSLVTAFSHDQKVKKISFGLKNCRVTSKHI